MNACLIGDADVTSPGRQIVPNSQPIAADAPSWRGPAILLLLAPIGVIGSKCRHIPKAMGIALAGTQLPQQIPHRIAQSGRVEKNPRSSPVTTLTDCPTFVDLRALVQSSPAATAQDDPFGTGARQLPVRAGPCALLAISLAGEGSSSAGLGADTWVIVERGSVTLTGPAGDIVLREGQSAVIARATPFTWRADGPATLIAMAYPDGAAGAPGIIAIDNDAALAPSNPPAAHLLLGETPSCRSSNQFASADETFKCGLWDSTPYQRTPIHFHHTELMHLTAGEVTFTDAAGRTATFRKGDTYIIEQGADCSWDSQVDVAKIYALFRPAA